MKIIVETHAMKAQIEREGITIEVKEPFKFMDEAHERRMFRTYVQQRNAAVERRSLPSLGDPMVGFWAMQSELRCLHIEGLCPEFIDRYEALKGL